MSTISENAKAIFLEAVEKHAAEEWPEFLDRACGDDEKLRQRVEGLLQAQAEKDSLFDRVEATRDYQPLVRPGQMIGAYKIREQIGDGGMGVVYVAEQEKPLRRKVALKVIKPGMDSKAVLARFDAERNALALMNHPHIAKVFDAGSTDQGHPYFVMELIQGKPVTEYCDQKKLTINQRLDLFTQVCNAIQHAHQKGVIHRDIKPSNILVTEIDGKPVPKVIDFGVAKALGANLTDRTVYTSFQSLVGTPLYMSPEQTQLSGVDVDTSSDVYSLGILLYELLTGTTPLSPEELKQAAQDEVLRRIRETEPPRPSNRISSLGETTSRISECRGAQPEQLGRLVRGDLDWIVMKALEKDRNRRYKTADGFAADIGRHLANEPVEARPPSTAYRLSRFYRRNRTPVGVAAFVFTGTVLLAFALAAAWRMADQQRIAAQAATRRLQTVNAKLQTALAAQQTALNRWTDELYHRALTAAYLGKAQLVEQIIAEARAFGASPNWGNKVRARLALFQGKMHEAISTLQRALEDTPDDVGARAMLAAAYLDAGNQDQYFATRNTMQLLLRDSETATSPEDQLLVAHAEMFGDIQGGIQRLKGVFAQTRSPLALAFLSQAHTKLFYETRELAVWETADRQLAAAKLLLGESAFVSSLEYWVNCPIDGVETPQRSARAAMAIAKLEDYSDYPMGRHTRACHFDSLGQSDLAEQEWKAASRSQPTGWMQVYHSAFKYRLDERKAALGILKNASEASVWARLFSGEALALEADRKNDARDIYQKISGDVQSYAHTADDFISVPETILLLLGAEAEASNASAMRLQSISEDSWQKRLLGFIANRDASPDELLRDAKQHRSSQVSAHRLIAFRHLCRGEVLSAQEHLREACRAFRWHPEAYWAAALLARLETDSDLRERLAQRKQADHEAPSNQNGDSCPTN